MIVQLVRQAVILLNMFPAVDFYIMTRISNLNYNHLKVVFGPYVLVFEDNDPSNTTRSWSMGAIALNPTGNAKGDFYFLSL